MDIKNFLEKLGFINNLFLYAKEYKLHNYTITIDLKKEKIYYRKDEKTTVERQEDGQIQIGDHTTSNFAAPENFVVLECIDRLLEKGYSPNDIHIERRWKVGHGASGGKADINVYDKEGKTLMIIECKTWGEEFEKEKVKMNEHGGQLFTYLNQDKNAKFLILYTSKFENDTINYENLIVKIEDRDIDLKKSLKEIEEENIKLYRDANNKTELFTVWKETYNQYFHFNGIFDDDAIAYSPELLALKRKNLKKLEDAKGLFNKFAEILRHNNISDNANAFNRILSLFLCKIVDEEKKDEDILDFQVKEEENYENLVDRLQRLYQKGMLKLNPNEEFVYYADEVIENIIKLYPKQTPIEKVQNIFRDIKYYTNNEFAFKEVHNKKLFEQNGRVLEEVIKLIQNYQFRFTSKQQVLGDFFELMLNHGVKQSEGQFFTPIPIVRFIILSLGFENIINEKIKKNNEEFLPKILDYACGAGHFLTESIEELQQILKHIDTSNLTLEIQNKVEEYKKGTEWAEEYIFGIEKDYRLARTSQIACYINGDGDANIIFGDGLEEHERLKLEQKKFDIVIANPPYSVEAFKNYLNVGKAHFDLFLSLSERSSEIETLFIERTKQVLSDNGLAGIVLPSTILSNAGIYTKAREIFLKHFEIKAITELGSKTFIATGTTTIIIFLKRRNDDYLKDINYIADDLYNGLHREKQLEHIHSERLLQVYINYCNFELSDYKSFLQDIITENLKKSEMFKDYFSSFEKSTEIKNLKEKPNFKKLTENEQQKEIEKRFLEFSKVREKEKFIFFCLCLRSERKHLYEFQKTIIVKTGKENNEQKEYLGYEFVGRKGQEGIKINELGGKLFDDKNYENPEKANYYIRNFIHKNQINNIHETQQNNINIFNTADLINFGNVEFEKIIKTNIEKKQQITTKWELVKFDQIATLEYGQGLPEDKRIEGEYPVMGSNGIVGYHNEYLITSPSIIIGRKGSAGKINYIEKNCFPIDTTYYIKFIEKNTNPKYFVELLKSLKLDELGAGVGVPGLSRNDVYKLKLPKIPFEIQEKIVEEIVKIEKKEIEGQVKIEKLNSEISNLINNISSENKSKLIDISEIQKGTSITKDKTVNGNIPVVAGGQQPAYFHNEFNRDENVITVSASGAYAGFVNFWNVKIFASDCTTIKSKDENMFTTKLLYYILKNQQEFFYSLQKGQAQPHVYGKDFQNLEIPLPTIEEQKKLIKIIEKKETEIENLKNSISNIDKEKEEILKKYL